MPVIFFSTHRSRLLQLLWCFALGVPLLAASAAAQGQSAAQQFKTLSEDAAKAGAESRLDDAAALYARALALQPRWADGWWALGTLEYEQDRYGQAAAAFEQLVRLQPKNGTARAMLGLCQFQVGNDAAALNNLIAAKHLGVLNDAQLQKVTLYHAAILQLRAGRFGDAQENLKLLLDAGTENPELALLLGQAALKVRPATVAPPGSEGHNVLLRVGRAEWLKYKKQFAAGKEEYASVVREHPDYPNLHFAYGRFLLDASEPEAAVGEFAADLKANPDNVSALLEIAAVKYRTDSAEGIPYAERALAINPQHPFAHYLLGLLLLDTGQAEKAVPHLEAARKTFSGEAKVYFALGNAYAKVGRKEDAAKARAEFVRLNKTSNANAENGSTVYDEEPAGILSRKLGEENSGTPAPH